MVQRYGWDMDYIYNVFGADEHVRVTLYRLKKDGTKWKPMNSWCYSTFLSSRLAHRRAEHRIARLRSTYNAEAI